MKRWLGLIFAIGLLGMLSEGDASFGAAAIVRDKCMNLHEYTQREYGDSFNQFYTKCSDALQKFQAQLTEQKHGLNNLSHEQSIGSIQKEPSQKKRSWFNKRARSRPARMRAITRPVGAPQQEAICNQDAINKLVEVLIDKISYAKKQARKRADEDISDERPIRRRSLAPIQSDYVPQQRMVQQSPQPTQYPIQPSVQYVQPVMQQPIMYGNGQQTAACAMQLQASAMAMQAQASAMMMQAQQQAMSFSQYGMPLPQSIALSSGGDKKDKINRLLQKISVLGAHGSSYVLKLLDAELDIIEQLLAGVSGQVVDALVKKRDSVLQQASPLIISAYELVIDLAASEGKESEDPRLYYYFVRKGKRSKGSTAAQGRKTFLRSMIYQLEQYYQMIEKTLRVVSL